MINPQPMPNKCLKVSGLGTISVSPDQAKISLGVITENKSLQQAQEENAIAITNIIAALVALGIPKKNIQTINYQIDPVYDYKDGVQIFRGYKVTHQLQITIDNIGLTGQVVDHAVNQGANTVSNIQFTVAHPEMYYNEALKLALQNAYAKALSLTSQLPVTLNPVPVKIEEFSTTSTPPVPYPSTYMLKAEAATPIEPGEMTITAKMIVNYLYC